ncbi:MAG: membrane dipeptidase [Elusimicrobia bacterium]|nr:membrane dipeptidase [Elusimicrobiota bacterium]
MQARDIHGASIIIDACANYLDEWTDNIARSGVTAFNLTLAGGSTGFAAAGRNIGEALQAIARTPDRFVQATTVSEIERAKAEGKVAFVFHFQNGEPLERDVGHLILFRELGVRIIELTYNERNFIGDGCTEVSNAGLSHFGRQVVKMMNELGMLVDLSHVGERTSLEALTLSSKPCIFSHSNPRRRVDNPRNITDEQIKLCAEGGGVIGACSWGPISWTGGDRPPGIQDLVENIECIANLAGVDHVGVASDTDLTVRIDEVESRGAAYNAAYPGVMGKFVEKFGHSLETRHPVAVREFPAVTARLLDRGWNAGDVAKVMGGNLCRVYRQVWGT